jgi:hypothetical protein
MTASTTRNLCHRYVRFPDRHGEIWHRVQAVNDYVMGWSPVSRLPHEVREFSKAHPNVREFFFWTADRRVEVVPHWMMVS